LLIAPLYQRNQFYFYVGLISNVSISQKGIRHSVNKYQFKSYKHFVKQLLGVGAYLSGAFYAGFTPVLTFLCAAGTPLVSAA